MSDWPGWDYEKSGNPEERDTPMTDTPKCPHGITLAHGWCPRCPISPETPQGLDFEAAYATATQRLFDAEQAKLLARKWLKQDLTLAQVFDALQAQHRALVAAAVAEARREGWEKGERDGHLTRDAKYATLIAKVREWQEAKAAFEYDERDIENGVWYAAARMRLASHPLPEEG